MIRSAILALAALVSASSLLAYVDAAASVV
ncbi:hypothetical protein SPMU_24680 [Sphingomonas mucosissima]|uniref:Uncharacterized protein n=1 Tax=Sphingomonas mucosissima TaxID=370959 RepID=A0A245ZGT2_9SPHN|nr:hypothetical protein SPMU_24680 [Sphingomonas mucosissima]